MLSVEGLGRKRKVETIVPPVRQRQGLVSCGGCVRVMKEKGVEIMWIARDHVLKHKLLGIVHGQIVAMLERWEPKV